MPNNNNKKSNSSKTSMSFSSVSKTDWQMLAFIALIVMVFAIYYVSYKNNRESFEDGDGPDLNVKKGEIVVALFYADWCPHCVSFKPHYKKAMTSLGGNQYKDKTLRFVMVDCDKNKSISKKYDVSGFPTVKILNDDKTIDEYSGDRSLEGLTNYFS